LEGGRSIIETDANKSLVDEQKKHTLEAGSNGVMEKRNWKKFT
jgi:hypothetical protein